MPRSSTPPPRAGQPGRVLRGVALTAVSAGVLVLAAAAFVLSYAGIHAIARQAGVTATLARGYPVILDAMLVVACAAVLALRGAGWVSKCYAWLVLLVLLGAAAGADALHSTGTAIPHRSAAAAAAVIPWVLLLIGFGLLLAILRHFRLHRAPAAAPPVPVPVPAPGPAPALAPGGPLAALPPGQSAAAPPAQATAGPAQSPVAAQPVAARSPLAPSPVAQPAAAVPPVTVPAQASAPAPETTSGHAVPNQAVPAHAGPGQAAAVTPEAAGSALAPADARAWPDDPDPAYLDADADDFAATGEEIYAAPPVEDDAEGPAPEDSGPAHPAAPRPAFHRMWSSPTPPGDEEEA